ISSLLLFVFTVAMVMADYSRTWKQYQREFNRLQVQRVDTQISQAKKAFDQKGYDQLEQQLKQAQADQKQNEAQIEKLQKQKDQFNDKSYGVNQNYKFQKALYDAEKYTVEEAVAEKRPDAQKLRTHLDETEKKMNDYKAQVEKLTLDLQQTNADLAKYVGKRDEAQKGIDAMFTERNRLEASRNTLSPGLIVTSFRNAPVFDF